MSPLPQSGKRPEERIRWLVPSARRRSARNAAWRSGSSSTRALILRLRAAAFGAVAISGLRAANHSCSWSLILSHGGFPSTTSKPGLSTLSPNTFGKATCQWKNP